MTDSRHIRHLQTIGHVAGETGIDDGSLDAVILHNVHNLRHEWTRLPGKGAAWFKDDFQMRIAYMKILQGLDEQFHIVVLACHQMPTSKVNPFDLRKPLRELLYDMY